MKTVFRVQGSGVLLENVVLFGVKETVGGGTGVAVMVAALQLRRQRCVARGVVRESRDRSGGGDVA